jgi:ribonucleoside-diphosphate reductase alpha chain
VTSLKVVRPKRTKGSTIQRTLGCGHIYITINHNGDSHPIEVLTFLGKSGSCSQCQNEALSRAISIGLRYGVPPEEYIEHLKGIKCPNPNMFPKEERNLSCADALANALEEYIADDKE